MDTDIDVLMEILTEKRKKLRKSIKPISKNIVYKPTFDSDYYRESILYRFIELAESSCHLYKLDLLIGAVVSVRAAQETLAVAWFINSKLEQLTNTKDLAHFSETMKRLIVGWSNDEVFPEKINIFKCIDSVDKVMEGMFRKHYEMLCEYAHPNYSGTFGAYGSPNHETLEVTFGNYPRSKKTLKSLIESTLKICLGMLDLIEDEYITLVNSALDVCQELHKQGKLKDQLH